MADAVLPRDQAQSATRARDPSIRPAGNPGASGITVTKPPPESKWQKQWMDMQQKVGIYRDAFECAVEQISLGWMPGSRGFDHNR